MDRKFRNVLMVLAMVMLAGLPASALAQQFRLDSAHCWLVFQIRHNDVASAWGQFSGPTGQFTLDAADPTKTSIQVEVKAANVVSGNPQRDNHLRGPDFFDANQFPNISFKSTAAKKAGDDIEVTGDFSMHGVTKPITVVLKKTGEKGNRVGLETSFTIKRSDYGMTGMTNAIADEVKLHISLEGTRGQ